MFFEGTANLGFSELAEGLEQATERPDIAEYIAFAFAKGLASDGDSSLVDFGDVIRPRVAGEQRRASRQRYW